MRLSPLTGSKLLKLVGDEFDHTFNMLFRQVNVIVRLKQSRLS